jgi:hypothetical protein
MMSTDYYSDYGVPAFLIPLRQVEEEHGDAFFRAHATEQQHDAMVSRDLTRRKLVEVALQWRDASR